MAGAFALPHSFKVPQSVLVVIYTTSLDILLIRRADSAEDFWQSVTGSKDAEEESFEDTAVREVFEETGIDARHPSCHLQDWELENVYEIYPWWRHRYAPGVISNTEHVFGLRVESSTLVTLNPREHTDWAWLPWQAAADRCFSPSNAEACLMLPRFIS
ncbi:MAG: dihydroneopterin triphosphate diphosphatase [Comamonadaceae bacterium]|nr:dihydroneopterin triphosphate diphosphatase [Comamonadaceae bacterium]